jgi:uncharacterized membrane protein
MKELIPYIFFSVIVILFIILIYFHRKNHKKFIKEQNENWVKFIKDLKDASK